MQYDIPWYKFMKYLEKNDIYHYNKYLKLSNNLKNIYKTLDVNTILEKYNHYNNSYFNNGDFFNIVPNGKKEMIELINDFFDSDNIYVIANEAAESERSCRGGHS